MFEMKKQKQEKCKNVNVSHLGSRVSVSMKARLRMFVRDIVGRARINCSLHNLIRVK